MLKLLNAYRRVAFEFRDYRPARVTLASIDEWLAQHERTDRALLLDLLRHVRYVGEVEARRALVDQNKAILGQLQRAGVPYKKVIYVQVHDAGSSSPVMLNELRDAAQLIQRGCNFVDSKDVAGIARLTERLGDGAIIYVDDFIGSGHQMIGARNHMMQYAIGSFSEFALAVCICEEGAYDLTKLGVEPRARYIHARADRPLHELGTVFDAAKKQRLIDLCAAIDKKGGLGYEQMATMVVLYRNAPNTCPRILRGSQGQSPMKGLFPRTTDLPVSD